VIVLQRDARGRPLIENGWMFFKNEDGQDVKLTIDRDLQYFVEQQIQKVMEEYRADSASAVVVDVASAEVRAMANRSVTDRGKWPRNSAVVDAYEPGSTLKSMLLAAALEEKVIHPNTMIDTGGGVLRIGKRTIKEADQKHSFESLTASEVLAKSSNVGSAQIAFMLGAEKYREYLRQFGFGEKTGFQFPGEARGILHDLPWRKEHLASVGFGHGMTASLLQIATAYTTLAYGGVHRSLKIVDSVRNPKDGRWKTVEPESEPRRVVSQSVADTVSLMLAMATSEGGTGKLARVPGFAVAGKTGTAQMVNPAGGGYLPGAYIASFAGYFPLPNPKFVIVVSVNNPKGPNYYGSHVAAPLFASIASHLSRHEGLVPRLITKSNLVKSQPELPWEYQQAQQRALAKLIQQSAGREAGESSGLLWRVPDLKGKSLREVKRAFEGSDRPIVFMGSGARVKATVPEAGVPLAKGQKVRVIF
jgi:cell division protein FtsI (penicillin-binding protein 3)